MKIDQNLITTLITFIIGGGLATFITQVARSWGTLRSGARASTREVVKDLAAARDEAEEREADIRRDKDYWRNVAGGYAFQLRSAGIEPDPPTPLSPSEVRRDKARAKQQVRDARGTRASKALDTGEIARVLDDEPDR